MNYLIFGLLSASCSYNKCVCSLSSLALVACICGNVNFGLATSLCSSQYFSVCNIENLEGVCLGTNQLSSLEVGTTR